MTRKGYNIDFAQSPGRANSQTGNLCAKEVRSVRVSDYTRPCQYGVCAKAVAINEAQLALPLTDLWLPLSAQAFDRNYK